MKPSQLSYFFLGSFLGAACFLQWFQKSHYAWWLWSLFAVVILISVWKKQKMFVAVTLGVLLALVSVMMNTHEANSFTADTYATSEKVELTGKIVDEPDKRPLETKYTIEVSELKTASGKIISDISGKVLATDPSGWPEYKYGDTVKVFGVLEKPKELEDFNYAHYLSRYDVYSVMYRANLSLAEEGKKFSFYRILFSLKEQFEDQINRLYPEPHASFMAGLLTGSRKGIPDNLLDAFKNAGLTHIVAISGFNITIIVTVITGALFWLPLKKRFLPASIAIILFTIFVGASAAVVRAAIMGLLGLFAVQTNRISHARLTLLWTAFFMVLWNPKYLWYDAGFQLSFLSVIGLMEIAPLLEKHFERVPKFLAIRESLQMTIAAQIATFPLTAILFKQFSIIAPIANLLVAPFIPLAMLLGFISTVLGFISEFLGLSFAYLAWITLEWIMLVGKITGNIPYATLPVSVSTSLALLYVLFLLLWRMKVLSLFTIHRGRVVYLRKSTAQLPA